MWSEVEFKAAWTSAGGKRVAIIKNFLSPFLISDRFNTSISSISSVAFDHKTSCAFMGEQVTNGAQAFDFNAGSEGVAEDDTLHRMLRTASIGLRFTQALMCIDSSVPKVISASRYRNVILNCYSGLLDNPQPMLEAIDSHVNVRAVIAVCIDPQGANVTPQHRVDIANRMADELSRIDIPCEKIIFDPVTLPESCGPDAEALTYQTAELLRETFPMSGVLSAVSNYSFGMSKRRQAERQYVLRAKAHGATVFLLNALDSKLCELAKSDIDMAH